MTPPKDDGATSHTAQVAAAAPASVRRDADGGPILPPWRRISGLMLAVLTPLSVFWLGEVYTGARAELVLVPQIPEAVWVLVFAGLAIAATAWTAKAEAREAAARRAPAA